MLFSRSHTLLCALETAHTAYTIYFFLIHHCTNSLSSLHIFVHHCTLKQALPSDQINLVERISCVSRDLHFWMKTNRLNLNPSKTPLIWFGTRQQLQKLD